MNVNDNEVIKYIEPVFHFCVKRLNNRQDAEDLAGEIMVHVLNGIKNYRIDSLEGWVWRIAHNRYARYIDAKNKQRTVFAENDFIDIQDDYDFVNEIIIVDEYQKVFKYLHTLSSEYRDLMVDYYIEQMPVKQIAKKYTLTETTVKWRLNISREKIKARIGGNKMDKVYKRINWNTDCCNGAMNPNKYLYSQIARAICEAAYEKPLTVEEISLKSGLPTMYIEDELPRLINGDAVVREGNKYSTNFIVLRLCDKKVMETKLTAIAADIADYFSVLFKEKEADISKKIFYGSDFSIKKLGFIALPAALRGKITQIKNDLNLKDGPFPPRLDGGYGWFIIEEADDEKEMIPHRTGLYIIGFDENDFIYYFSINKYISKYFHSNLYDSGNGSLFWLMQNKIVSQTQNGVIPNELIADDDKIRLLKDNLIIKNGDTYKLNFPVFSREQYDAFLKCFDKAGEKLDSMLTDLITGIHKCFKTFTPKRLESQINQWVSGYVSNIAAFAAEELIVRGVLERTDPDSEKPSTNGIFFVFGKSVY